MDTHTAAEYLRANFEASDRIAIVAINRATNDVKQRIATVERITQDDFQRWLRFLNKENYEVYVSMNTIGEGAFGRKKSDIAEVRHVYLDFDNDGTQAVREMMARPGMPIPNHLIESSPGKWQAVWRVQRFQTQAAEDLMRGMVREFGADPAAVDSARVLRLPGLYNHKYQTPHLIGVQNLSVEIHTPSHFPSFAIGEAAALPAVSRQPCAMRNAKPTPESPNRNATGLMPNARWRAAKTRKPSSRPSPLSAATNPIPNIMPGSPSPKPPPAATPQTKPNTRSLPVSP
jgi:hypothetical protein